jgi:hypothetical protein
MFLLIFFSFLGFGFCIYWCFCSLVCRLRSWKICAWIKDKRSCH